MAEFQFGDKERAAVIDLIAESWRLNQFTKNLAGRIADSMIQKKSLNSVARFEKHFRTTLETLQLEILDFTGAEFEIGLPVTPINLGDFAANEILCIEMMLEPTIKIVGSAEIVKKGTVVLRRKN